MASNYKRSAFTLVELLVVITIIGMLVALVSSAIISSQEAARTTKCTNNLKQLLTATINYESNKRHLPGMINPPLPGGATPTVLSWPVVLFQYLGRNDLWETYRFGVEPAKIVQVEQLTCPSDLDALQQTPVGALGYVANWDLFRDRSTGDKRQGISLSAAKTPGRTPLISERLTFKPQGGSGTWVGVGPWAPLPTQDKLAFVWPVPPQNGSAVLLDSRADVISANHKGRILVGFCDGSVQSLNGGEVNMNDYYFPELKRP